MCDLWQWQDTISHLGELFIIICSVTQLECIHHVAYTPAHTLLHTPTSIPYAQAWIHTKNIQSKNMKAHPHLFTDIQKR